jgi:hypothetical protein
LQVRRIHIFPDDLPVCPGLLIHRHIVIDIDLDLRAPYLSSSNSLSCRPMLVGCTGRQAHPCMCTSRPSDGCETNRSCMLLDRTMGWPYSQSCRLTLVLHDDQCHVLICCQVAAPFAVPYTCKSVPFHHCLSTVLLVCRGVHQAGQRVR